MQVDSQPLGSELLRLDPDGRSLGLDGGASPTRTGLRLSSELEFDSWERIGHQLFLIADSSDWWLADWLIFGQGSYGQRYKQALAATRLDYQTLRNYAWVGRKFEMSRRRDNLSFQHHAEVAALPIEEQEAWLDRAAKESWSRSELRRQLREYRARENERDSVLEFVRIPISPDRHVRWAHAASIQGYDLPAWLETVADAAADAALSRRHDDV